MADLARAPAYGSPSTAAPSDSAAARPRQRSAVLRWLVNDIPYLLMLALAAVGVVLRLPVQYWVVITPVFAIISVIEGWRNFAEKGQKFGFAVRLVLDWAALLLALILLYDGGVQGVMNANTISLAMMTLLALGTFVAGIQARVWQICAVGCVLFLAVPGLGWLDQSPLLLLGAACVVVVCASVAWWLMRGRHEGGAVSPATTAPRHD